MVIVFGRVMMAIRLIMGRFGCKQDDDDDDDGFDDDDVDDYDDDYGDDGDPFNYRMVGMPAGISQLWAAPLRRFQSRNVARERDATHANQGYSRKYEKFARGNMISFNQEISKVQSERGMQLLPIKDILGNTKKWHKEI